MNDFCGIFCKIMSEFDTGNIVTQEVVFPYIIKPQFHRILHTKPKAANM